MNPKDNMIIIPRKTFGEYDVMKNDKRNNTPHISRSRNFVFFIENCRLFIIINS
jgi:hypothetical protein